MGIWNNKVALIINCKGDEGIEILKILIELGMMVVGFLTIHDFQEMSNLLQEIYRSEFGVRIKLYKCDLTNVKEIKATFAIVKHVYGGIDVLVNSIQYNTGCCLLTGELESLKKIINININAVIACTRLSIECMIERKTRGHIIFLDHFKMEEFKNSMNSVVSTCNAAVKSINEILRHEFRYLNVNIKSTYITTEEVKNRATKLKMEDIAKVIMMILDTPEHLHIHEMFLDTCIL